MKAASYIGKDALMQVDFGKYEADSAEKKLDVIVDELIEAQTGPEVLNDANTILREKVAALSTEVETLKDRMSPDVQYLYGEIERLQAEVRSANADLEKKTEALDREILRTAERDRLLEEMRKESKPTETTGIIDVSVAAEVPALEESHTLKSEIDEVTGGIRKFGNMVAHVVGVRH
jgi:chromosome segregation ATPase